MTRAGIAFSQVLAVAPRGVLVTLPTLDTDDFVTLCAMAGVTPTTVWLLTCDDGPKCLERAEWTVDGVRFQVSGPARAPTVKDWPQLREEGMTR